MFKMGAGEAATSEERPHNRIRVGAAPISRMAAHRFAKGVSISLSPRAKLLTKDEARRIAAKIGQITLPKNNGDEARNPLILLGEWRHEAS